MPACAFLTMDDMTGFVSYDTRVREPLARRGWSLDEVPWRSRTAVWQDFDVVVIRTTWDYQDAPTEFLRVLEHIDRATRLENPLATVRWNLDKRYLQELAGQGIRIVPTTWGEHATSAELRAAFDSFGTDQIVIKPQVGANADDAVWLRREDPDLDDVVRYAAGLFAQRSFMLQPFMTSVIDEGEHSLIYFAGAYSHTILKTPKAADFRVQEEHGGVIRATSPEPLLRRRADAIMATFAEPPLYARVDLVRTPDHDFALMELELIEPSLYLSYDDGAAERFATAITRVASG
ncbi:ATP-grasp domain protein [soil metagenome]